MIAERSAAAAPKHNQSFVVCTQAESVQLIAHVEDELKIRVIGVATRTLCERTSRADKSSKKKPCTDLTIWREMNGLVIGYGVIRVADAHFLLHCSWRQSYLRATRTDTILLLQAS